MCTPGHIKCWSTVCCWEVWSAATRLVSCLGQFLLLAQVSGLQHHTCALQVGASSSLDSQATALTQKYIKVADPCTFRLIAKNVVNILPVNKKQLKEDTYKELDELIRWAASPSSRKGANKRSLGPGPLEVKPPLAAACGSPCSRSISMREASNPLPVGKAIHHPALPC